MSRSTINCRLAFTLLTLASAALPSWAATQTVTNTNDNGPGSLRAAMASAASGDTVSFNLANPSTITLASPITIGTSMTINGPGATQLAISGNHSIQVFSIDGEATVAISGLTIENANSGEGGAILNYGTLSVTNSTLSGNSVIYYGGAILNYGALTVTNSTLSGNSAYNGGGIVNYGGALTVTDSTLSSNSAQYGGAIANFVGARLTVTNSTLSGNSTISGGSAIYNVGTLDVTNDTISGNLASFGVGGINSGTTLTINGTLLAGNTGGNCLISGQATSQGYNLSDDSSCAASLTAATDRNGIAAGLDPQGLKNNGGPTQTIALLSTSPAVDAIPVASCTDTQGNKVATDQRGVTRPQGSGCDIGAFELVENVPFSSFCAQLEIFTHRNPGFNLFANFTLAAGQTLTPLTEAVTLTVGSYSVTLPAGSFHKVQIGPVIDYVYAGTINNVKLDMQIAPFGGSSYGFQAAATPVTLTGSTSSVPVTLTIVPDTGTTTVTPVVLH